MDSQKKIYNTKRELRLRILSKKELLLELSLASISLILAFLFGKCTLAFDSLPLGFALLAGSVRGTPFVYLGLCFASLFAGENPLVMIIGASIIIALRLLSRLTLDKPTAVDKSEKTSVFDIFSLAFSEHTYLKMMSGALGVFFVGVWKIITGGFRFYDLFASIFYLVITPTATFFYSQYFESIESRLSRKSAHSLSARRELILNVSLLSLGLSLVLSLSGLLSLGLSLPVLVGALLSLYFSRNGVAFCSVSGLLLGLAIAPKYAPVLALYALTFVAVAKISLPMASISALLSGMIVGVYVDGISALGSLFPALLSASMLTLAAKKMNISVEIEKIFTKNETSDTFSLDSIVALEKAGERDKKIQGISDSFSSLSEIFYNLSSKLKRPALLDLRKICADCFHEHCSLCPSREHCLGVELTDTLEQMKAITLELHENGFASGKKLSGAFSERCADKEKIIEKINKSCAIATKNALQNDKTEIFALDYDAISKILNDALTQNEDEFKIDHRMSKRLSKIISDEGYGEHSVTVFGKRRVKIIAKCLDLSGRAGSASALKRKMEDALSLPLEEPTFELSFGCVNMHTISRRAYGVECAYSSASREENGVCGDTVSIFENKNDYVYALISDGMGSGQSAALTSEISSVFLRNMLFAGNKTETSIRMLNSILRAKGNSSIRECSATVDLLQFDLYSGKISMLKSGAAPTFIIRGGNVFKICAPSLPIGILHALDAKQIELDAKRGDVIVMVSDGVTRQSEDCEGLVSLLKNPNLTDDSPQKIADGVLKFAKDTNKDEKDDISVAVLKIV